MNETAEETRKINVADEFLSEGEDNPGGEEARTLQEDSEFEEEVSTQEATLRVVQEPVEDEFAQENEVVNENSSEFREEDQIGEPDDAEEDLYESEVPEGTIVKLRNHYSEMNLLIDALELQITGNQKMISDQKMYIKQIEEAVEKLRSKGEEEKKQLRVAQSRLEKAEKKIDIVKKELLD